MIIGTRRTTVTHILDLQPVLNFSALQESRAVQEVDQAKKRTMAWWDPSRSRHYSVPSHHIRKRSPRRHLEAYSAPAALGRPPRRWSPCRTPRPGFISRMIYRIKQLLYEIYYYARHHPIKVFLLVIVPLIMGGILQKLLAMVGLRLPRSLRSDKGGSGGYGRDYYGTGSASGGDLGERVKGLMTIAKMFL